MDFFRKKFAELKQNNLSTEIESKLAKTSGKQRLGALGSKKDLVINSTIDQQERIYIRPSNSIVKNGLLLGQKNILPADEQCGGHYGSLKAIEKEDISLDTPKTIAIYDLFESAMVCSKSLLVIEDYIEIIKNTSFTFRRNNNNNVEKIACYYKVSHFIEVLDSNQTYRIPTTLFGNIEHETRIQYEDEIDFDEVTRIYNKADLESIIDPLKIIS